MPIWKTFNNTGGQMTERRFTAFGQPHGKGRPRFSKTGRIYTDSKTHEYEYHVMKSYLDKYSGDPKLTGDIAVSIRAYYKIPKTRPHKERERCRATPDVDNVAKSVLDALNGVAWDDDRAVNCLLINKYYSHRPRVEVTLQEIEETQESR